MRMDRERFVLSLLDLPGVGRKSAWKVVRSTPTVPTGGAELLAVLNATQDLRTKLTPAAADESWASAQQVLDKARKLCIEVVAATNPSFPAWLRNIPDPPLVLFIKGNAECVNMPFSVAVIGTREPTTYGCRVAHRFGQRAAEAG